MSDTGDEDLLNCEEFDYEGYNIEEEEEEALLEEKDYGSGDEENFKSKNVCSEKKESLSENDEQEDVLNLDIEEDFQVEDKEETNEKSEGKLKIERPQSNVTTKLPPQAVKRPPINIKSADAAKTKEPSEKNLPPKIDNRRKRGIGRGNFQPRSNFIRNNNMQKDRRPGRRNGTVFINPKYEGFVHINENNARLAWDNSNYGQNNANYVQPWAPGNLVGNNDLNSQNQNVLLNNLVGIAATFSQSPNLLQLTPAPQPPPQPTPQPPPVLNFEPPPNIYQNQVPFQPVPSVQNSQPPFHQNPVPPPQTSFQAYHGPPQFNHPPPSSNYNYYNNNHTTQTKTYQGGNFDYNVQNTYQNKSLYNQNSKINRNPNYNSKINENSNYNYRHEGYKKNMVPNSYQQKNINERDFKITNSPNTYNNDYNRVEKVNYNSPNRPFRQTSLGNESLGPNSGNFQRGDRSMANRNFAGQRMRRNVFNNNESKMDIPEKRIKTDEDSNKSLTKDEEIKKSPEQRKQPAVSDSNPIIDEEEDEEMRLYRLKIEEQKRQREKVLKMKEERRRMMLLQQAKEEEKSTPAAAPQQPSPPEKSNFEQPPTTAVVKNYQQRSVNQIPVLTTQNKLHLNANNNSRSSVEEETPNLTFKISNNFQRKIPTTDKGLLKNVSSAGGFLSNRTTTSAENPSQKDVSTSNFMSDRVVVVKSKNDNNEKSGVLLSSNSAINAKNDSESSDHVGQGLSSFFNNRKVLKKDNTLINTRLVVVSNLSASTTQNQLTAMTRGIGEIQKLRMDKQERQATILFKSVASAHAFFKKYQRHMLDLSMIQVKLEPML